MIELLAGLALEVAKYINTQASRSRADKIRDLKTRLSSERAKGQLSDDGEVERLQNEIQLEVEAMYNEILVANAHK